MNKNSFLIGLAAGVLFMCAVILGYNAFDTRVRWGGMQPPERKVQEIFRMLERHSIFPIDREEMLTHMYRGLLEGVGDPYTQYFDAVALEAFHIRTEGVFGGIGVMSIMDPETRMLTVANTFLGYPADKAGILPGDKIVAVDGADVVGQPQDRITNLIRGPVNTPVRLTILRPYEEKRFEVSILRALVEVPTVSHEMLAGNTGLIRLDGFDRVTLSQFEEALADLTGQNMTGLIIDVRNNPGGLMPVVVQITNRLVPYATLITYTEHADGRREYHHANTADHLGLPLVMLVNGRSASASEILSAAVQETGVGLLVGTQTFGKGIVQNLMYLTDGNAIKMTVAKYFTPEGTSIHGVGIAPDIVVEMDEHLSRRIGSLDFEEDVQLQAAWRLLHTP
ncbi:MAG: S41 family peptidase [Defluviitaleaceae bacterium]|nr:S41 family peptidase [Defluviitaleaceae bacterium]MCL2240868.1 S41 family peptidase [Defluviitaleaceae bacterium]